MFDFPFWAETAPPVLNRVTPTPKVYRPGSAADDDSPTVDFITLGNSPTASATNTQVVPTNDIVDDPAADGRCVDERLRGRGLPAGDGRQGRARHARHVRVRPEGRGRAAGGRRRRDHLQRRRRPRPPEPDVRPQPGRPAHPGRDLELRARQGALRRGQGRPERHGDLSTFGTLQDRFLPQVLAETKGGDKNNVLVVGAHLDSVPAGPGINDDGSGTATLLAQAEAMSKKHNGKNLRQKIRFGWFGAEENGLVGSTLLRAQPERRRGREDRRHARLRHARVAELRPVPVRRRRVGARQRGVPGPARLGSDREDPGRLVQVQGPADRRVPFDGRSDYVGFTDRGIPAGGIFAGAEEPKTPEQEAIYGGAAGSQYDVCYHEICDDFITILTGIPPLTADGLIIQDDDADDRGGADRGQQDGGRRAPRPERDVGRRVVRRLVLLDGQGSVVKGATSQVQGAKKAPRSRSTSKSRELRARRALRVGCPLAMLRKGEGGLSPLTRQRSYGESRSARQLPSGWSRKCSRSWRRSARPCQNSTASGRRR